ncbi:MAG: hypothetical protein JWR19_2746 [Pedosphaera sp.]|nr:hypothetical protein [Pedosphaera sp.]
MKHTKRTAIAIAIAITAGLSAASSAFADTTLLTFDTPPGFTVGSPYVSWGGAGFNFGTTSYDVSVPAGGFGGQYVEFDTNVDASGNIAIELTINMTTSGSSAAILVLGDNDGTEQGYQWYGLSSGPHVLVKALGAYGFGAAGTTNGLDLAHLKYVHLQGDGDPYTIQWQNLRLTGPAPPPAVVGQTVLVDFGSDTSFRGVSVVNPDVNGHYWNSVQPGAFFSNLVDTSNQVTTIDFGFDGAAGTDSYNGPAGATSIPPTPTEIAATDIDPGALGNLGIINAAFDYVNGVGAKFQIQQLDPTKKYNLTFFGSHKFNSDANTIYSVYSDSTYTTLIGRTNVNVFQPGSPWLHNRDQTVTISNLSPPADNIFYVSFVGSAGGDGFLNAMQISVVQQPQITSQSYNPATSQFTLTWTSAPGKTYSILTSTNLLSGFTTNTAGVASGGASTTTTVTLPTTSAGFLRVQQE